MKKSLIIYFLLGLLFSANAQNQVADNDKVNASLLLRVKGYKEGRMVLRWNVDNTVVWPFLQQTGFWIDYAILDENNRHTTSDWVRLNPEPVRPWTEEKFRSALTGTDSDDDLLIAAQALYGSTEMEADENDLGSIIDADMAYQNIISFAMLASDRSPIAADAMGLRYEYKTDINSKYKYAYRIYPAGHYPLFEVDTAYYIYAGFLKDEVTAPNMVKATGRDGYIEISWPKDGVYNTYTFYNIERSADGKKFQRLNPEPLLYNLADTLQQNFTYSDSVANYTTWYYRVNGVDAFGDESYWSITTSAMASNQNAPPVAYLYAKLASGSEEVELKWDQEIIADRPLQGYVIRRGPERNQLDEAIHAEILPPDTRTFRDKPDYLVDGVYYQVIAIDTAGNYSMSNIPYVFAYDTIPPAPPTGFRGTIDSLGVAHLEWDRDYSDNVYAYRLFVANNPEHTFSPVNAALIEDVVFTDSLSSTISNRKIYYKLVALDGSNNHSEATEILTLTRPKLIASPAPVIGLFTVGDKRVTFEYSFFEDEEIMSALIYRRQVGETEWNQIASLPPNNTSYTDTTVNTGVRYQYMVRTKDVFDMLSGESFPVQVSVYNVSRVAPDLQVNTVSEQNSTSLQWVLPNEKIKYFIVYKDTGNGFTQYKSVPATETHFSEASSGRFRYGIKAVYEDNNIDSPLIEGKWIEANN